MHQAVTGLPILAQPIVRLQFLARYLRWKRTEADDYEQDQKIRRLKFSKDSH